MPKERLEEEILWYSLEYMALGFSLPSWTTSSLVIISISSTCQSFIESKNPLIACFEVGRVHVEEIGAHDSKEFRSGAHYMVWGNSGHYEDPQTYSDVLKNHNINVEFKNPSSMPLLQDGNVWKDNGRRFSPTSAHLKFAWKMKINGRCFTKHLLVLQKTLEQHTIFKKSLTHMVILLWKLLLLELTFACLNIGKRVNCLSCWNLLGTGFANGLRR